MTLHASVIEFLITAAYIVIFGFIWRWASSQLHDSPWGKAMGYIY